MRASAYTVGFVGIDAKLIEVQASVGAGLPSFNIVGLPDKAINEARERVRAAFDAISIGLPARRITVNLSPSDLPKEGSHFDLPIALAVLAALEVVPADELERFVCMGELSLNGRLMPVAGTLPAMLATAEENRMLLCPHASAPEAAIMEAVAVFGAHTLLAAIEHIGGKSPLPQAQAAPFIRRAPKQDMSALRGQHRARRALEIAAAGRHHMLLIGPPGAGKSMLAVCLQGIMPPLSAAEALETAMIHSLAGNLDKTPPSRDAPFREPHHNASVAALTGGGKSARPGEISLAHNGVLFLDEMAEFKRDALDTLRQPLEAGHITVSRANMRADYPCKFLLVGAANPCRCGHLAQPERACGRAPACGRDYMAKISGPLMDRIDLRIEVPPLPIAELGRPADGEASAIVAARVASAREIQQQRYKNEVSVSTNADASGALLDIIAAPCPEGRALLQGAATRLGLTARGYHRVLRVARTIADLAGAEDISPDHLAEAISYRIAYMTG